MLTVTTPAPDTSLLTLAELRTATGVGNAAVDSDLTILGSRVASAIANICRVASSGATPPTLRLETLTETFRHEECLPKLILARRPIVAVSQITEDGVSLDAAEYEIDAAAGLISRLHDDRPASWPASKIVVAYQAGWETVPDDLKLAASKLAAVLWSEGERVDPNLRSEEIPGVISRTWWVGPSDDPLVPAEVMDLLTPYIN